MKHNPFLAFLLVFSLTSIANTKERTLVRDRESGSLFFEYNGRRSLVNEHIVTVKVNPNNLNVLSNLKIIRSNRLGYIDIEVPNNIKVEDYVEQLTMRNDFEGVYYAELGDLAYTPNDPSLPYQHHLSFINVSDAWNYSMGSSNVKVAVLDSKIDASHPDLGTGNDNYSNISTLLGADYTTPLGPHHHGTGVAGVISAKTNNNLGICGIAGGNNSQGSIIIPCCVTYFSSYDNDEHPDFSVIDDAIIDAVDNGAKIINMSLGHKTAQVGTLPAVDAAITYAYNHGVTLIAATGNDNYNGLEYPANHPNVIAVGACDSFGNRIVNSTYGNGLDLVAYWSAETLTTGMGIYDYWTYSGTSFSTPQVAGVAALLLSVNPYLTPSEIRQIINNTASKNANYSYNSSGWCDDIGYGYLNARAAVSLASAHLTGPNIISSSGTFSIENLSEDFEVIWTLSDSYYDQNCIQKNYPTYNKCVITRSSSIDMNNAVLTATIKCNGKVVKTLSKSKIYAHSGFKGTYYNGQTTKNINLPIPLYVLPYTIVKITSPNLIGATVSHSGDASITEFTLNNTSGILFVGMPYAGTCMVSVNCSDGNVYYLPIIATNNMNLLSVTIRNNQIEVSLIPDSIEKSLGASYMNMAFNKISWKIEVFSALSGEKVFEEKITGKSYIIDTTGWKPGIYVIRATIGNEVLNEKVIVK